MADTITTPAAAAPPRSSIDPKLIEQRRLVIQKTVTALDKQFGSGAVLCLGSKTVEALQAISTGSISLDAAMGIGGFPKGRISEVFGPESSGKTTLTLHVIAEAQRHGAIAAFIDAEHALDPTYARKLGVDIESLLISQPDSGEQALEIASALVATSAVELIVIDSVAALVPKAELDGEMGDSHMGLHARLMSQALRKLTGAVSRTSCCLIFINQIREKIGVMFGSPETTTGGRALKFYASMRADVRRIGAIKDGDAIIGNRTRVKMVKNKCSAPFTEAEFDILYGEGISREGDLIDCGSANKVIDKSGAWYSFQGERLGQGRDAVRAYLKEHPDKAAAIDSALRKALEIDFADRAPQLSEKRQAQMRSMTYAAALGA